MSQRLRLALLASLPLAVAGIGCQSPSPEQTGAPPAATANAPVSPEAFRPAGAAGTDGAETPQENEVDAQKNYAIHTSTERAEDGSLALVTRVEPRGEYHLNAEPTFPWRVSVAADAPVAAGTSLGSADATLLTEQEATFRIDVAEPPETAAVNGSVVIGVCDDAGCVRVQEEVTWEIAAR